MTTESYSVSRQEAARLLGLDRGALDHGAAAFAGLSKAYIGRLYEQPRERPTPAQMQAAWLPELADRRRKPGLAV